jgi:phage terminase large subunit
MSLVNGSLEVALTAQDIVAIRRELENRQRSLVVSPEARLGFLLFQPMRYKILYGGRASGKSWAVAEALVRKCQKEKTRVLCVREYQNSISESAHKLLEDTIHRLGYSNDWEVQEKEIFHKTNGSHFFFKGMHRNEQGIRSTEGVDICWIEEAQSVTQSSLDSLFPTIRKKGSEIWIVLNTPETWEKHPIEVLFSITEPDKRPDNAIVEKVNYYDNPHLSEALIHDIEVMKSRDFERYAHVYLGEEYTLLEDRIIRRVDYSDYPREIEKEASRIFFGADFGFAKDPSTLIKFFILNDILYIADEQFGDHVELDDLPAMYDKIPGSREWLIKADCARPETISHLKSKGYAIEPAAKWSGSIEEGLPLSISFTR